MNNKLKVLLIYFISFAVYFVLDDMYFKVVRKWFYELSNQFGTSHILTYAISGIPLFLGTILMSRKTSLFDSLGLNKSIVKGFLFSLICTLPLFLGYSFVFDFNPKISLDTLLISIVSAGFFEELFFRGFLFGQLFKNTKLGFVPSVFFGALSFGLIHLYQSTELAELVGIFLITFLGGILFSWAYAEWNYNIWVPIFIHMLMNLSFELFSAGENALGGIYMNIFRIMSIILIIAITVIYKKRKKIRLEINKNTIWIKNETYQSR